VEVDDLQPLRRQVATSASVISFSITCSPNAFSWSFVLPTYESRGGSVETKRTMSP
jgi:hypothetical protein